MSDKVKDNDNMDEIDGYREVDEPVDPKSIIKIFQGFIKFR